MRYLKLTTLVALAVAFALTLGAARQPAEAAPNLLNKEGNLKAWAMINADGTIESCWRCNTDALETQKTQTGVYEVDFTPLATDISARPRLATPQIHGVDVLEFPVLIDLADRSGDLSSVFVVIRNTNNTLTNAPFVLVIY